MKAKNTISGKLIPAGINLSETNYRKLLELSEETSLSKREVIEALLNSIKSVRYNIVFIKEEYYEE